MNNTREGKQYLLVNVDDTSQEPAFNHDRLSKSLSNLLDEVIDADSFSIDSLINIPGSICHQSPY